MSDYEHNRDEREGFAAVVEYEVDGVGGNPREWDNLSVIGEFRRGTVGFADEVIGGYDEWTVTCPACEGSGETAGPDDKAGPFAVRPPDCPRCDGLGEIQANAVEYLAEHYDAIGALPIRFDDYGSSGQRIDVVDDWDNANGAVYATNRTLKMIGTPLELVEEVLRGEVENIATYLRGEVYWWHVDGPDGEMVDSVGGYLGEPDYAMSEAIAARDGAIDDAHAEAREVACWAARDVETVA